MITIPAASWASPSISDIEANEREHDERLERVRRDRIRSYEDYRNWVLGRAA